MDDLFAVDELNLMVEEPRVSDCLSGLNPPQLEAVKHINGPILVLAGAGSGKTRVLTHRIAHLILNHNVYPWHILAVTFTNKAANEMKNRLKGLLGEQAERVWMATFHSAALRILRAHAEKLQYPSSFAIYDDNDSKTLIKRIMKKLNIDEKKHPASMFISAIDRAKNDFISVEEFSKDARFGSSALIAEVYQHYQQELLQDGAMDFGDLLMNAVTLFKNFPDVLEAYRQRLHYILVDEFQDTNHVQYLFIKLLSNPRRNIFVVGDDDQSIYAFRGADISNILNFENDFSGTKVVTLEQNYRSTQTILDTAFSVISKNVSRKAKKLWTNSSKGSPVIAFRGEDEDDEASFIAHEILTLKQKGRKFSDAAIFYRTNAQSRALEEALLKVRIPYRIFGGLKFYERKEVKDVLAYLKLITNENDSQSFLRALNTPPRGIGAQSVTKISQLASANGISLWQAACQIDNSKIRSFIELMSEFKKLAVTANLDHLINQIVEKTGYMEKLKNSKEIGAESRVENIRELISLGRSASSASGDPISILQAFLDKVSLTTSDELSMDDKKKLNSADGSTPDAVSMMTLHLAKGLEFPVVFLTGLEEGLLPHQRSMESKSEIEEERRLCYVGITRAREILYLTHADVRGMFSAGGDPSANCRYRIVSRFYNDIPKEYLNELNPPSSNNSIFDDEDRSDNSYWNCDEYTQREEQVGFAKKKKIFNAPSHYPTPPPMSKKSALQQTLMQKISANLSVADAQMSDFPEDAPLLRDHVERAREGLKVLHANFGEGIIVGMDVPASKDPDKTKIRVLFNGQMRERTLLLGRARLAIVE